MTAKSVLMRPQGLRPRARAPTCYATELYTQLNCLTTWCSAFQCKLYWTSVFS